MKTLNAYLSKLSLLICFLSIFSFIACQNKAKKLDDSDKTSKIPNLKKPPSSFSDTLVINTASAIFFKPDSVQLIKIGDVNQKMIFESLKHDCFYQMRNARIVMKQYWPQIKVIESSNYRYLLFKKSNNENVCIDINNKNDICGIFLFDKKKDPALIDMMNIETALDTYFKSK